MPNLSNQDLIMKCLFGWSTRRVHITFRAELVIQSFDNEMLEGDLGLQIGRLFCAAINGLFADGNMVKKRRNNRCILGQDGYDDDR